MDTTAVQYKVWDATLSQGQYDYTFRWVCGWDTLQPLLPLLSHAVRSTCAPAALRGTAKGPQPWYSPRLRRKHWKGHQSGKCTYKRCQAAAPVLKPAKLRLAELHPSFVYRPAPPSRVMEAKFGADASTLVGPDYPIAVASPLDACAPLSTGNASLSGTIVLVQRGAWVVWGMDGEWVRSKVCWRLHAGSRVLCGWPSLGHRTYSSLQTARLVTSSFVTNSRRCIAYFRALCAGTCLFSEKALAAQNAGAAGVLIYDNNLGAYFPYSADQAVGEDGWGSAACTWSLAGSRERERGPGSPGHGACAHWFLRSHVRGTRLPTLAARSPAAAASVHLAASLAPPCRCRRLCDHPRPVCDPPHRPDPRQRRQGGAQCLLSLKVAGSVIITCRCLLPAHVHLTISLVHPCLQ